MASSIHSGRALSAATRPTSTSTRLNIRLREVARDNLIRSLPVLRHRLRAPPVSRADVARAGNDGCPLHRHHHGSPGKQTTRCLRHFLPRLHRPFLELRSSKHSSAGNSFAGESFQFFPKTQALEASAGAHSVDADKPHGQPTDHCCRTASAVMELAPAERRDREKGEHGRGVQPGEVPVSSSCETAAANCANAKDFSIRTLPSTACDFQSGALALVM